MTLLLLVLHVRCSGAPSLKFMKRKANGMFHFAFSPPLEIRPSTTHKRFSALFYWCGGVAVVVMLFYNESSHFASNRHKGEMPFLFTLSMTTSFRSYNLFFLCRLLCTLTAVGVMRIYIHTHRYGIFLFLSFVLSYSL